MKFGLAPPNYARWFDADAAVRVAALAEELGFDSLWFGDHVALPKAQADVFGNAYLDVFPLLGFLAGTTSRLRLGTNVVVIPYRNPVVTAKMIATLDQLSRGRIDFGVGIGHVAGEFEALGVSFADRGRLTDEFLRVMRELWTQDCASFAGRWISFTDLCPLTRPVQDPLPLLIGGDGPRSMRRALEFGAGWAPGQGTIDELAAKIAQLRELAAAAGKPCPRIVARWLIHPVEPGAEAPPIRHRGELRRPRLEPGQARDELAAMTELGVDEIVIDVPPHASSYLRTIEFVATTLLR
jgi:probable F420-dependent oxidoreductase